MPLAQDAALSSPPAHQGNMTWRGPATTPLSPASKSQGLCPSLHTASTLRPEARKERKDELLPKDPGTQIPQAKAPGPQDVGSPAPLLTHHQQVRACILPRSREREPRSLDTPMRHLQSHPPCLAKGETETGDSLRWCGPAAARPGTEQPRVCDRGHSPCSTQQQGNHRQGAQSAQSSLGPYKVLC